MKASPLAETILPISYGCKLTSGTPGKVVWSFALKQLT